MKEGDEEVKEAGEEVEETGPVIDFDRLLLKHREAREFSINNTCAIPVAWRLKLSDQLREKSEFEVGQIMMCFNLEQLLCVINFEAIEPNRFQENIKIGILTSKGAPASGR